MGIYRHVQVTLMTLGVSCLDPPYVLKADG
jgi:hypothetical protein